MLFALMNVNQLDIDIKDLHDEITIYCDKNFGECINNKSFSKIVITIPYHTGNNSTYSDSLILYWNESKIQIKELTLHSNEYQLVRHIFQNYNQTLSETISNFDYLREIEEAEKEHSEYYTLKFS